MPLIYVILIHAQCGVMAKILEAEKPEPVEDEEGALESGHGESKPKTGSATMWILVALQSPSD